LYTKPFFGYGKLTPCHTDAPKQGTALVFTPPPPLQVPISLQIRRSEALYGIKTASTHHFKHPINQALSKRFVVFKRMVQIATNLYSKNLTSNPNCFALRHAKVPEQPLKVTLANPRASKELP